MVVIDEKDVNKSKEELLMDLIAEWAGFRIPLDKITYGLPEALDQRPDLPFDPNTFIPVVVDMQYDARYSEMGDGFMYRRRSIVDHLAGCDLTKVTPTTLPFSIHQLMDEINKCVPYPIDKNDVIDHVYETEDDYKNGIRLQAHPHSYLWMDGETFKIDDRWINNKPLLTNLRLDGFYKWTEPVVQPLAARITVEDTQQMNADLLAAARARVAERRRKLLEEQGLTDYRRV